MNTENDNLSEAPISSAGQKHQAVIDRFEGEFAVLLVGTEERRLDVPRQHLPSQAREGQWLRVEMSDDQIVSAEIDKETTEVVRERIQEKLARLRRGNIS